MTLPDFGMSWLASVIANWFTSMFGKRGESQGGCTQADTRQAAQQVIMQNCHNCTGGNIGYAPETNEDELFDDVVVKHLIELVKESPQTDIVVVSHKENARVVFNGPHLLLVNDGNAQDFAKGYRSVKKLNGLGKLALRESRGYLEIYDIQPSFKSWLMDRVAV